MDQPLLDALDAADAALSTIHAPDRTPEEMRKLHQIVSINLDYVVSKARALNIPPLGDFYRGTFVAKCAPADMQLDILLLHMQTIVDAEFIAHTKLDDTTNHLIFYYGFDQGHSFSATLRNPRMNLLLAIVLLGHRLYYGVCKSGFEGAEAMFESYISAWTESLCDDGQFESRKEFLDNWSNSAYDMKWFTATEVRKLHQHVRNIEQFLPPSPLPKGRDFLDMCQDRLLSTCALKRHLLPEALRYLLSIEDLGREVVETMEAVKKARAGYLSLKHQSTAKISKGKSKTQKKAEKKNIKVREKRSGVKAADLMESVEVEANSEPLCQHEDTAADGTQDDIMQVLAKMTVNYEKYPIPDGIDLADVDWDAPWLQALIHLSKNVPGQLGNLRASADKDAWITFSEAEEIFGMHDMEDMVAWMAQVGIDSHQK